MSIGWYMRRLRRMDAAEIVHRGRDEVVRRHWRRRQVCVARRDPTPVPRNAPPWRSSFLRGEATDFPPAARARLIDAANALMAGRWPVFDRERDDMAETPDWFLDPATSRRAPQHRYAFDIDCRSADETGNIKYVWETSRHHHLTVLAAAYFLSGDERYACMAGRHLSSWWEANPFLSGVHWTSGIELGVRLVAWVWTRRLLDGWVGSRELFEANPVFLQQLRHHQEYLSRLSSHGSSANNHLLAEAAGQFAASCAFPYFEETAAWRDQAAVTLARELDRQTFECGINRELATDYHGFVLELGLAAALEGERAGHSLGKEAWEVLRRMMDALAAMLDVRLRPPRQGDSDDGVGLLLDTPAFDRWSSLLATGEALFGAAVWWPRFPRTDLRSVFLSRLAQPPPLDGGRPSRRPVLFADAGMVILRDRADSPDEIWCRCDHGPHGYLAIAAHAHADALSIELRYGGIDILADPGTYLYHGASRWRRYFCSTLGHNTLELDATDQSVSGGDFLWMRHARAELLDLRGTEEANACAEWHASHDGYSRLDAAARHQRKVRIDRKARKVVVEDRIAGHGQWPCRLALHLGPAVRCSLSDGIADLRWAADSRNGAALLVLPPALSWSAVSGRLDPPLGWYSPRFGEKVPTTTLVGMGVADANSSLVTELWFGRNAEHGGAEC